jgi:CBS domain-containing protein
MTPKSDQNAEEPRVADIMERAVVTVTPKATIQELALLLREKDVRGVCVVDDAGRLVGVVTEGDIIAQDADLHFPHYIQFLDSVIYLESMKKFGERLKKTIGTTVGDIMTDEVFTVTSQNPMSAAATIMRDHKINLVPVVDGDKLVGAVTRHDVIASLGF